jgi:hypothetical protein
MSGRHSRVVKKRPCPQVIETKMTQKKSKDNNAPVVGHPSAAAQPAFKKKPYGSDWAELVNTNSMQCLLHTLHTPQAGREGNQDIQDDEDSIRSAEDAPEPNQDKTLLTLTLTDKQRDEAIMSLYRNYIEGAVAVQSTECNQSCDAIGTDSKPTYVMGSGMGFPPKSPFGTGSDNEGSDNEGSDKDTIDKLKKDNVDLQARVAYLENYIFSCHIQLNVAQQAREHDITT